VAMGTHHPSGSGVRFVSPLSTQDARIDGQLGTTAHQIYARQSGALTHPTERSTCEFSHPKGRN
jgi:hypothetical protein